MTAYPRDSPVGAQLSSPLRSATDAYYWKPMTAYFCARELEVYEQASPQLNAPVLDLGCGNGLLAGMLRCREHLRGRCVGMDVVPLREARCAGAYDDLCQASGESLPFGDGSFASVVSHSVMSAVPDVDGALSEVHRVLIPGGRFLMTVPTDRFTAQLPVVRILGKLAPRAGRAAAARIERRLQHRQAFTVAEWRERLCAHDFDVESEHPFFWTHEIRTWSALANPCMRVCGLLRVEWLAPLRPVWRAVCRTILGRLSEPFGRTQSAAYVMVLAKRRDG